MTVSFRFAAITDLGTVRTNNEDTALATPHLLALADGMGGHAAGEVASAVAMRAVLDLVRDPPAGDLAGAVVGAAQRARGALHAMSRADPELEGMGTTLVVLAAGGDGLTLAHIGDSRLYRMRDGQLTQLTVDHTHVQRLVDNGQLTPAGARTHPYRSMILRSLDDTSDDEPDIAVPDIAPGDRLLLCSDGLSDYVADEHLEALLADGDVEHAAQALVDVALTMHSRDNVTVVVADVLDDDAPDAPDGVAVGASLDAAVLSGPARRALQAVFDDVEPDADTVPRPGEAAAASAAAPASAEGDEDEPDLAEELLGTSDEAVDDEDEVHEDPPGDVDDEPADPAPADVGHVASSESGRSSDVVAGTSDPVSSAAPDSVPAGRRAWPWVVGAVAVLAAAVAAWWVWLR
ncbi:protein serine/threonine phosphatase [Beutenbergia cavernae DSM 12333]|uniref:Protein serine/threonine phosphatase n=1 Tax=Beutenbergia cavernae (strain ATCC BAA-8 / DSM 12333 / CCUG 43141 / JCM 11478 / NBRC 16432 / NCIMB 13614 / HKI 0122) TaxID=471853 RepID=C5C5D4_BEUC1|nr:protein phosphatase 2C domain-containing protein [Beutenbergia cavernae]ACQ82274.1 protein serine/threonine phosphatase [Beutenbergia cavernae DSM 12333]